jgi:hypothetical protein
VPFCVLYHAPVSQQVVITSGSVATFIYLLAQLEILLPDVRISRIEVAGGGGGLIKKETSCHLEAAPLATL